MLEKSPEELRPLGFLGIIGGAFRLLHTTATKSTWPCVFFVTTALILPLAAATISFSIATHSIRRRIAEEEVYGDKSALLRQMAAYGAAYLAVALVLWAAAQAALTYAVGRAETARENVALTLRHVMRALPRVTWRTMATLLWWLLIVVVFGVVFAVIVTLLVAVLHSSGIALFVFAVIVGLVLSLFFLYVGAAAGVSCVVCVFEDEKGISAIRRAVQLLKGKRIVAIFVGLWLSLLMAFVHGGLVVRVAENERIAQGLRILGALGAVGWSAFLMIVGILGHISLYCVCRGQHFESIDLGALSRRLEEFCDGYLRLGNEVKAEEISNGGAVEFMERGLPH